MASLRNDRAHRPLQRLEQISAHHDELDDWVGLAAVLSYARRSRLGSSNLGPSGWLRDVDEISCARRRLFLQLFHGEQARPRKSHKCSGTGELCERLRHRSKP